MKASKRSWLIEEAKSHLVEAAFLLSQLPTEENLGLALIDACVAVIRIAKADENGQARVFAEQVVRELRRAA